MGTRADFYLGRGEGAEWLGSIGFDGYPYGLTDTLSHPCPDEAEWRQNVSDTLSQRDDATRPERGWPWPWDDSRTTDYSYAWEDGVVWGSCFGHPWFPIDASRPDFGEPEEHGDDKVYFPNMADRKNVRYDKGSGAMFISFGGAS